MLRAGLLSGERRVGLWSMSAWDGGNVGVENQYLGGRGCDMGSLD